MNENGDISDYQFAIECLSKFIYKLNPGGIESTLYHYTSMDSFMAILKNNSFRLSNMKYLNDWTEGRLITDYDLFIKENDVDDYDDYILSLSNKEDDLGQWRGYCPNGGVSIGLHIGTNYRNPLPISVIHPSYSSSSLYYSTDCIPLPLLYLRNSVPKNGDILTPNIINDFAIDLIDRFKKWLTDPIVNVPAKYCRLLIPYLKHPSFYDESEVRLVIRNEKERLNKYISHRLKESRQVVPYIDIMFGNIGLMAEEKTIDKDRIVNISRETGVAVIPCCSNQEKLFDDIDKKLHDMGEDKIAIICEGRLPIVSIKVAPSHHRDAICKQLTEMIKSRYWLKRVQVEVSDIPYIPPND